MNFHVFTGYIYMDMGRSRSVSKFLSEVMAFSFLGLRLLIKTK